MKASNCHDPKMEAYCKEVRRLEDKFHGLELVHIARRYNEATDELTKIASTRGTVPPDTFSRDLHEPLVNLGSGADIETTTLQQTDGLKALLAAAEVMEAEQRPDRLPHAVPRLSDPMRATRRPIRGPPYRSTGQVIRNLWQK